MAFKCVGMMPRTLLNSWVVGTLSNGKRLLAPMSAVRCCSGSSTSSKDKSTTSPESSSNDVVSPEFINRNPRNLELLGIARKRRGWRFQAPPVSFYHRVILDRSPWFVSARVEHCSGKTLITASTKEFAIAKGLYSTSDASAAENIGRVLAQRCRESGITSMKMYPPESGQMSEKFVRFINAMEEGGIEFEEPIAYKPPYEPGIDYDNEYEIADLKRRQKMASTPKRLFTNYGFSKNEARGNKSRGRPKW